MLDRLTVRLLNAINDSDSREKAMLQSDEELARMKELGYNVHYIGDYYKYRKDDYSAEELDKMFKIKVLKELTAIKWCVLFFAGLTALALIVWLILALYGASALV